MGVLTALALFLSIRFVIRAELAAENLTFRQQLAELKSPTNGPS
jgi:hypothetical protein